METQDVLIKNEKDLTKIWMGFLEDYKLYFLMKELDNEYVEEMKKYSFIKFDKYMDDLGIGDGNMYWRIIVTFKYKGEELSLDAQETEIEWHDYAYNKKNSEAEGEEANEHFEEMFTHRNRKIILDAFLNDILSPTYNLGISFDIT